MAERIRLSRARGWSLPKGAVVVSRPSRWGNPFLVGQHGTRLQCGAMFGQLTRGFIDLGGNVPVEVQMTMYRRIRRYIIDLRGKDLACWCPLDGDGCHADVLLWIANPDQLCAEWMSHGVDIGRVRIGIDAPQLEKLNRAKARKDRAHA